MGVRSIMIRWFRGPRTERSLCRDPIVVEFAEPRILLDFSEGNKTEVRDRSCQWSPFGASVA